MTGPRAVQLLLLHVHTNCGGGTCGSCPAVLTVVEHSRTGSIAKKTCLQDRNPKLSLTTSTSRPRWANPFRASFPGSFWPFQRLRPGALPVAQQRCPRPTGGPGARRTGAAGATLQTREGAAYGAGGLRGEPELAHQGGRPFDGWFGPKGPKARCCSHFSERVSEQNPCPVRRSTCGAISRSHGKESVIQFHGCYMLATTKVFVDANCGVGKLRRWKIESE